MVVNFSEVNLIISRTNYSPIIIIDSGKYLSYKMANVENWNNLTSKADIASDYTKSIVIIYN